jgi:hypothetical protein
MPGLSYLFLWPALSATATLWIVTRQRPPSSVNAHAAMLGSLAPGCLLFSPASLLAYHALTIALLPALVGLTSHLMFLAYLPETRSRSWVRKAASRTHDDERNIVP